jgi:hypothetical protein
MQTLKVEFAQSLVIYSGLVSWANAAGLEGSGTAYTGRWSVGEV